MKVHQLIQLLDELDSDGDVYVLLQPHWPLEASIRGIAIREDFACPADPEDGDDAPQPARRSTPESALPRNDVFIVVGEQVRYGNRDAWDVVRYP
jgi:hypothetical protein